MSEPLPARGAADATPLPWRLRLSTRAKLERCGLDYSRDLIARHLRALLTG